MWGVGRWGESGGDGFVGLFREGRVEGEAESRVRIEESGGEEGFEGVYC